MEMEVSECYPIPNEIRRVLGRLMYLSHTFDQKV